MKFKVQIIAINDFGEFIGEEAIIDKEGLSKITDASKNFYKKSGFELHCENGDFVVFPPEVVKKTILKIKQKKID
jgi:hypothetical protein